MTDRPLHITWGQIVAFCSAFLVPGIGIIITLVIFGTRLDDKVSSIQAKQDKQDFINLEFRTDINRINSKIDTVQQRQQQYHWENLLRQERLDKK